MKAAKENRIYSISEDQKDVYIDAGFDIYDDSGEKIASGKGKSVSVDAYEKLEAEYEKLKEEKSSIPDDALLPILTEFAKLKGIDIGKSATAKGVFDKISAAKNP